MFLFDSRRKRESAIVQTMIKMYCKANHDVKFSSCDECNGLSIYAEKRLLFCMYGDLKPVCKNCPVHCYSPPKREQMRVIMRWAGPRMLFRNPLFSLVHIIDNMTVKKLKIKMPSKYTGRK